MINLEEWKPMFLRALDETFGDRVWFVGLQGSYSRGEATETSDIDLVVILDEVNAADLAAYRAMLDTLPDRALLCGFFAGKTELVNWEPSDLFQFYHDTLPIRGSMDEVLHLLDEAAVRRAIKIGACNVYHGCVHNMLHGRSDEILRALYKSAAFVVQAICFRQTGTYISRQKDLAEAVSAQDRAIVETCSSLKNGGTVAFQTMSEALFAWAGSWIKLTSGESSCHGIQ